MQTFLLIVLSGALFYLLGKSADLIVLNVRLIGERLGIPVFFLGLVLGLFTSLPETAIGVNALVQGVSDLSFGNLIGGYIVLFTLVLGFSIVLNRKIKTDGKTSSLLPILLYLSLPFVFGFDGTIDLAEGSFFILGYFALVYYLYREHEPKTAIKTKKIHHKNGLKPFFLIGIGLVGLGFVSNLLMRLALFLLSAYQLPALLVGLLVFSVGTNLPEIIVSIRSYHHSIRDLTVSHLFGSAIANILLLGIFASIQTISVRTDLAFLFLGVFVLILFLFLLSFYRSQKSFSRLEGVALLGFYVVFLVGQIFLSRA